MGTHVAIFPFSFFHSSFDIDHLHQVPATIDALKTMISRLYERTGWDIKELFTTMELADMIDAVVKEPPHMCAPMILPCLCSFVFSRSILWQCHIW
jgi:hypothetical protein